MNIKENFCVYQDEEKVKKFLRMSYSEKSDVIYDCLNEIVILLNDKGIPMQAIPQTIQIISEFARDRIMCEKSPTNDEIN